MQIPHDNGVSTFRVVLSVIAYLHPFRIEGVIVTIPRLTKITSS